MSGKKTMVIEFAGPPGAGKTTSCLYFMQRLRQKNFVVYGRRELKEYVRSMGFLGKLCLYSKTLFYRGPQILAYTLVLAYNGIVSFDSLLRYLRLSVFDTALKGFTQKKNADFILLDQWIIQELWSATIFRGRSYDRLLRQLKRFYFFTDAVMYFDVDPETASDRIAYRKAGLSRFDKMQPEQRLEELKRYNAYLFQLYHAADCRHKYTFSTEYSPLENVASFLEYMDHLTRKGEETKLVPLFQYGHG